MLSDLLEVAVYVSPAVGGMIGAKIITSVQNKKRRAAIAPIVIDGRSQDEWYELISGMSKEDFEHLTAGVIDVMPNEEGDYVLERNPEFGWDTRRLMGERNYDRIMRKHYPEQFCEYCNERGCKETCYGGLEALRRKQKADRLKKAIAAKDDVHAFDKKAAEWKKANEQQITQYTPTVKFTQIRYLGTGLSGYRINFGDQEIMMSKVDVKRYQSAHKLLMDGIIGRRTQTHMRERLEAGLPLDTSPKPVIKKSSDVYKEMDALLKEQQFMIEKANREMDFYDRQFKYERAYNKSQWNGRIAGEGELNW